MIYPLYDFKKRENPENSQVIAISEQARELLHNLNKTLYALSSQYSDVIKSNELSESLKKIAELHKESNVELNTPPLVISTLGTTSSGKSTFINSLLGIKLSPMNADELSIGVLRFEHNNSYKNSCKLNIDTLVANTLWENGTFEKSYQETYNQVKNIMETYRKEAGSENLSPPYMTVETSFFAGNNPKFIGLDDNAKINVLELPLMIADSESLQFINDQVKASLIIFLIDYTVLFNKETKETNHLFEKLIQMKNDVGSKSAILFVLNKVDLRNYDDDELDIALEKCKREIKSKLSIKEDIDVIPLNALLMYYAQCAYLGYENGDLKEYNPDSEKEYTDTQKMYIELIRDNLKKCLKDQAKTIAEIQDLNEANVDMVYEIRRLLQKDKIPSYSTFEKLWKECIKKSGGLKLFEAIRDKNKNYLKELILFIPMYKIINESDNFLQLLAKQIVIDKNLDKERLEADRQYIIDLYNEIKLEKERVRKSLKTLLDDSFIKLRKPDPRFRKDAIKELDVGQIDETVDNIRKSVEKETIDPIEQAFIDEMRPDTLLNTLVQNHDWNESIAKQEVEHFDFLRVKLFNEKRFIDGGRRYEVTENDEYEKDKIEEINKQIDYLCQNLIVAVDQRLGFELQNHIDELAVRVSRWLIKKNKEIYDLFEKMLERLKNKHQLNYIEPSLIRSFKFENSFVSKIDIKPSVSQAIETIEVDRGNEPNYIKNWKTLWMVKVRDTITKEIDVTQFEPVRIQTANWSGSLVKLENDLWEIVCDSLYAFFGQALEVYDQINNELMQQVNHIFKQENDKLIDLTNKNNNKWNNIDNIFLEGKSLMKMMHNLTGIPDKFEPPKLSLSPLEMELAQQPGYKEHIEETPKLVEIPLAEETISENITETLEPAENNNLIDNINEEIQSLDPLPENMYSEQLQLNDDENTEIRD